MAGKTDGLHLAAHSLAAAQKIPCFDSDVALSNEGLVLQSVSDLTGSGRA